MTKCPICGNYKKFQVIGNRPMLQKVIQEVPNEFTEEGDNHTWTGFTFVSFIVCSVCTFRSWPEVFRFKDFRFQEVCEDEIGAFINFFQDNIALTLPGYYVRGKIYFDSTGSARKYITMGRIMKAENAEEFPELLTHPDNDIRKLAHARMDELEGGL